MPLLLTRSALGVFGSVSSSWEPRGCYALLRQGLPHRREGLDTGTFPGGRFRRSRNLHTKIIGRRGQRSLSSSVMISDKSLEMRKTVFPQPSVKTPVIIYTD